MKKIDNPIMVTRPYMPDIESYTEQLKDIWQNRWLTNSGPFVKKLELSLCEYLKTDNTVVYANGHLALDCAIRSLNLSGEIITTPFTYVSTVNAIAMNGLTPVFCDIKESDCTIDEDKIESLITDKTCAILPVHVYGFPCNYKKIQEIADRYNLKVIYDSAHAFGVSVDDKGIGTLGDVSMFSFHATKVFHTVEGGALTFNDSGLKQKLISSKNFGMLTPEIADTIGLNAKMSEFHAAMGLENLKILDFQIEKRREIVEHYLQNLSNIEGIKVFDWSNQNIIYNYSYFPVVFDEENLNISRDTILFKLEKDYNIYARKYFYPLINDLSTYSEHASSDLTPVAKYISDSVLTLPLYVDLTMNEVDYICDVIHHIIQR